MSLTSLRAQIGVCDQMLREVFQERIALAEKIIEVKKKEGLPFYDPQRESEILAGLEETTKELFLEVLRLSRKRQARLIVPFNTNVVLIGFMATGKTSVGRQLAFLLGRRFFDLDQVFEERNGISIQDYFQKQGEDSFRLREKELIREFSQVEGVVLAPGGGAILDPENGALLKQKGLLVLLTASSTTVFKRIGDKNCRPVLGSEPTVAAIQRLQKTRASIYASLAHCQVATDGLSVEEVVFRVLNELGGQCL